ncbi:MAG TPA: hypothetical protein VFR07_03105 [Mycobacteriales bacterium]|jgi:peptidoglycan/LPS O-acetylase OafA/YrhL|nr:hypothetical protein [Mycobacteriales bacterium]
MSAGEFVGLLATAGSTVVAGLVAREFLVVTRANQPASWFRLAAASAFTAALVVATDHLDPKADSPFVLAWAALLGGVAARAALAGWRRWGLSADRQSIELALWYALAHITHDLNSRASPTAWQVAVLVLVAVAILVVARQPPPGHPRGRGPALQTSG